MKKFVYFIYLLLFVLVFAEIGLRVTRTVSPGIFQQYNQFQIVDSLYELKNYTTDEKGIYKFSTWVTDSVTHFLSRDEFNLNSEVYNHISNENLKQNIDWGTDHVGEIFADFTKLELGLLFKENIEQSEFATFIQEILKKKTRSKTDSLVLSYLYSPFNSEGFRSIAFDSTKSNKIKVLLIGDSFTYGQSARPMYNSFADILLARGYLVFNTGISGTDPAQYEALAQKYIPLLQPDVVIVNYCINNDLMYFYRETSQEKPHEYLTNAGFFESYINGNFYSVEGAYKFYKELTLIPQTSLFNKVASKFAVTTKLWALLYQFNLVNHPSYDTYLNGNNITQEKAVEVTSTYLYKIKVLETEHHTPILFFFIPDISRHSGSSDDFIVIEDEATKKLAQKMAPHYPTNFLPEDFASGGDFHFNNKGATKYADFLDSLIVVALDN